MKNVVFCLKQIILTTKFLTRAFASEGVRTTDFPRRRRVAPAEENLTPEEANVRVKNWSFVNIGEVEN